MFQKGDRVIYGIHGVCEIVELEQRIVDRKTVEYYVLEPINQAQSRFYVPTENPVAVGKLRKVLTKQELDRLLQSELEEDIWIEDENRRKQAYRELIVSGDRASLIAMVRALHKHREAQALAGKKLHLCDENFLRDAERILGGEFALVLNIAPDEVGKYIESHIG